MEQPISFDTNNKNQNKPFSEEQLKKDMLYNGALGNTHIVQDILSQGIDPNTYDDDHMSLMHYAAQYGYTDMVDILLENPRLITTDIAKDQKSPFSLAIQNHQYTVIEHILSKCRDIECNETLSYATKRGSLSLMRALLTCKVNNNTLDKLLFDAAETEHAAIVKLLLLNGANSNYRVENRWTCLHIATLYERIYVIRALIESSANLDINAKKSSFGYWDEGGYTPLHIAVETKNTQVVQELLKHPYIDVNAETEHGYSPLNLATTNEIRNILIEKGAKITDTKKDTCIIQ